MSRAFELGPGDFGILALSLRKATLTTKLGLGLGLVLVLCFGLVCTPLDKNIFGPISGRTVVMSVVLAHQVKKKLSKRLAGAVQSPRYSWSASRSSTAGQGNRGLCSKLELYFFRLSK